MTEKVLVGKREHRAGAVFVVYVSRLCLVVPAGLAGDANLACLCVLASNWREAAGMDRIVRGCGAATRTALNN